MGSDVSVSTLSAQPITELYCESETRASVDDITRPGREGEAGQTQNHQDRMSYGSIDGGSFGGSRNPFGGPKRQGYQPVACQAESQDSVQCSSQESKTPLQGHGDTRVMTVSVVTLEKSLQSLGTSRDTAELRQSLHSTQQQTNKVITSTSQLIKQLSDIITGSTRQDRLRLTRLKTELSESVQRYGDLQKKIADRSRALLPPAQTEMKQVTQSPQTPFAELCEEEGPLFGGAAGSSEGDGQEKAFLSEISEEDVEALRQREEALLQIERDMLDVSQIMRDLASMVHEQGDAIDSIEDHIQTTTSNVESANQELAKASHHQVQ
ncbi:t-SNARE domain-containing protein 1 [Salvelinus namaycush]|uniref:t-SNARE domain-containing protein 1 n=1 Tax=Salvelinus namaycush TaxID=8040 RepID=A0A8U0QSV2_SALNM|nr:t-SNARE domain-containing protein 1 [Salvelinus namaycush]